MSLQFLVCQLTCGFFFTSHNMCGLLKRACQLTCISFLCKFLRVKRETLAKTLSNIYTDGPKAQRNPHGLGSQQRALGPMSLFYVVHLRSARASKELKYWLSWPQNFTALIPSVKRPLVLAGRKLRFTTKHMHVSLQIAAHYSSDYYITWKPKEA